MRLQTQLVELADQFRDIPEWYKAISAIALENKETMKKNPYFACSKQAYIAKKILELIKNNQGTMRIQELRSMFSDVSIDPILTTLNSYDFLTLFTGEVSSPDEYYKGIYLDPEGNPRTWVKVSE